MISRPCKKIEHHVAHEWTDMRGVSNWCDGIK